MNNDPERQDEISWGWILSPIGAQFMAILALASINSVGMDGAARSTAVVFWFLPIICFLGYKSVHALSITSYSRFKKVAFLCIWLVPSLPLSLMSLFGILLFLEIGFEILF
ncbi:hypothetical protein [Agarilytica rhodophyticola]|uniref:hypothetical protein n=1 Tax=Agarilytica rhodophyticola TaxID=1737490 RepID=UPI000B349F7E|nr:hypothetical protein [Agarilytica rhodophyticola]